ncbi:hypothetical protein ABT269_21595 [Streptomyces viridosporus]|uniref:hypothetical protein n=1 Tax=Streptomyces viridosporus TaxID=67581 RepID=UPI00332F8197
MPVRRDDRRAPPVPYRHALVSTGPEPTPVACSTSSSTLPRAAGLAVEALFSYAAHWRWMLAPLLGALEPKCDNTSCWRGVLREAAKYFAEGTNW